MDKCKMMMKKLLHPPKWCMLSVLPVIFAALIFIFGTDRTQSIAAYPVYCMSAYALVVLVTALLQGIQKRKAGVGRNQIVRLVASSMFGKRYLSDRAFRGRVSIYQGLAANLLYMIFRIVTGICYASVWFISMAAYYMMLGLLRAYLIKSYRKGSGETAKSRLAYEFRCYRNTAFLLFLLNVPMGGMIVLMVRTNSGFSYPGYVIYLSAIYAFYAVVTSIVNLVKFRKLGSPILSAAKVLNLIAAMMSILGLQTAMIARFSENGENYRKMMNAITGGCVYAAVIAIAAYMIVIAVRNKERRTGAMNKSESKYFNTAARMDEAFLGLLEKKDFEYITVKEICEKAEVNRSTFYLHYETVSDLLSESVGYMNGQFLAYMKRDSVGFVSKINDCPQEELYLVTPEYLTPYLSYISEHKRLFQTAVNQAGALRLDETYSRMFAHVFTPILDRFHVPGEERCYLMAFYIHGMMAVISQWLKNDCNVPVANIVSIIENCVAKRTNSEENKE